MITNVEKVSEFSLTINDENVITMKINRGFTINFIGDEYLEDFIDNVIKGTDNWNYPVCPFKAEDVFPVRRIEILLLKDKIQLKYRSMEYVFENNNIVRNEFRRLLDKL